MLEEILDKNNNVISTRKSRLINLGSIMKNTNKIGKDNNIKGLSIKKKLIYSLVTSFMFFYGLCYLNKYYMASNEALMYTKKCDYDVPWCLVKNYRTEDFEINSMGFKGDEFSRMKPENVYRIVVLGGSTSFGNYPEYLEDKLNKKGKANNKTIKFEVINGAIVGYNSSLILKRFVYDIVTLRPDLVIYGPEWNDVGSCALLSDKERGTLKNFFLGLADSEALRSLGPWYENHIKIFETYKKNFRRLGLRTADALATRVYLLKRARNELKIKFDGTVQVGKQSHMDDYNPTTTLDNLVKIINKGKENNIKITLTTTPDDFEDFDLPSIPPECLIFIEKNDWYRYNRNSLNPAVRNLALKQNLILIDLEKHINEDSNKKRYFVADDGITGEFMHFNDLGNKKVAEIMFKTLWQYLKDLP
ncbi:SGNH/GDSL hydrolase family protein [Candidatus Woesearchaeota archaeon]|nr:SGNH/GDSL hydrolase family protein [Candidatus Woesearchaeota archaeon]